MKKFTFIILQVIVFNCFTAVFSLAANSATMVNQGNKRYRENKYDEALKLYHQAQIKDPDSSRIEYNIGVAQFKKQDYVSAIGSFEKATATKDKVLEAKANYNIANSKYKLGVLKKNTDINQAVKLYRESLDYYKRAIDLDSKNTNAKINHELVEKELKTLLDQAKQQQDKQKEDQSGKQDQEKKDQLQGQGQDKAGQQEKQQEQKQSGQPEEEKQEKVGQAEEKQGQEKKEGAEEKEAAQEEQKSQAAQEKKEEQQKEASESGKDSTQEEAKEMSAQEARMLLEGARQDESSPGKIDDRRQGQELDVLKDW